jgi:formamidopyrimidine-DNA glycosylase
VPELPEVETVRAGLERFVVGHTVAQVEVRHPRAIRRHLPGADDFVERLRGVTFIAARRRGKYLWMPLRTVDGHDDWCLTGHLGMSGQLLLAPSTTPDPPHLHVRLRLADGPELRFVDQRTFGGLVIDRLVPTLDVAGQRVPSLVAHIARDPLDPAFDDAAFAARLRGRRAGVKRVLLDQTLISGVGNIYADEALWRTRLHGERPVDRLSRATVTTLLGAVRAVLAEAVAAGGTSFDALYVDVNGRSGYFGRTLAVYGRRDQPCPRCGTSIRRTTFMNRSSYFCPRCQPVPRKRHRRAIVDQS